MEKMFSRLRYRAGYPRISRIRSTVREHEFNVGIRFKLSLLTFLLVALITSASLMVVMNIMDTLILKELINRGLTMSRSVAIAAGYSMLLDDSLALDNLAVKLKEKHEDLQFVATVNNNGEIKAHSKLDKLEKPFLVTDGKIIKKEEDGSTVRKTIRDGSDIYEFKVPILFAGTKLGNVYLGIDNASLLTAQHYARKKILFTSIAILALSILGTFVLSHFITTPIKRLAVAVSQLSTGKYQKEIPVSSRDELGNLTKNFNIMAKTITDQNSTLRDYSKELEKSYISTVRVLAATIDARDPYTLGHSTRVARMSLLLGERLGLNDDEMRDLEMACLFHDVGKIRTPDHILQKQGPLTDEEKMLMMKHTEDGAEILKLVNSLHKHIPPILYHHEWYNGKGYPKGLKGDEIPLFALIISVADAYDSMTSSRAYRGAMPREQAIRELKKCRGNQFEPRITDLFIEILQKYDNIHESTVLELKKS